MSQSRSRRLLVGTAVLGTAGVTLSGFGGARLATQPTAATPVAGGTPSAGATPVGGAAPDFSARFAKYKPANEPNGDLAKVVWPQWLLEGDPEVKRLYEFQVVNGPLMRYMPCFCGCGISDGHRSNRDCYIQRVRKDGSVVFDTMAPT